MTQYIPKDVLVAEIERLILNGKLKCQQSQENNDQVSYIAWSEHIAACGKILSFLNTLEVKEMDFEKDLYDIKRACGIFKENDIGEISGNCLDWVAKHFFELGLKAAQKRE